MNAIYKTVATWKNREPNVDERETTLDMAKELLKGTCDTLRSMPGYDVFSTPDNLYAVIKTPGYRLEITVVSA